MAANTTQKQAARRFVQEWSGKGYEKGETQRFWISLLQNVFGVIDATKAIEFEIPVKTILKEKGSDFIDGYIKATKVLIEQKGSHVDLNAKSKQSDGAELTPAGTTLCCRSSAEYASPLDRGLQFHYF